MLQIISSFTFLFFNKTKIYRNTPIHILIFFYRMQICIYFPRYATMKCLKRKKSMLNRRIKSLKNIVYFHLTPAEWLPTSWWALLVGWYMTTFRQPACCRFSLFCRRFCRTVKRNNVAIKLLCFIIQMYLAYLYDKCTYSIILAWWNIRFFAKETFLRLIAIYNYWYISQ